ncbi:MAG: hypothetical protein GXY25_03880 [Pirellulaceae bacterium]|jgi:hypothetical protein|nr:hypothetical protein [Thermoguttaceae bacterium]MDI9445043.1 hypothetical protein [Planctomycetota bacterium]NLY99655.1 hypothetical protein [Pirellulaceae bacterium]
MTNFEKRLAKAIERGHRAGDERARAEAQKALSEKELRGLHTQYRIELSEHIERCLRRLPGHLPGFQVEPIVAERGWGAAASRDDVDLRASSRRTNFFSRLEILIRPLSEYYVLDVTAKATVRNREVFSRNHYQRLVEVDIDSFTELIDLWILEFAEKYAAAA